MHKNSLRFLLILLFTLSLYISGCLSQARDSKINRSVFYRTEQGFVSSVIDGDTFHLADGRKVRLLGINAPEKRHYLSENATELLASLAGGKNISMKTDFDDKDRYGRLLRYVFVNDTFINALLVREGLASIYIIYPNDRFEGELKEAEKYARKNGLGIWNISRYYGCFNITDFTYNALGSDAQNPNGEHVTIRNICNYTINMDKWRLKDESTKEYRFTNLQIRPSESFIIYSGSGKSKGKKLYLYPSGRKGKPVWNNNGDSLYLFDEKGKLALFHRY